MPIALRERLGHVLSHVTANSVPDQYHRWYYNHKVWETTTWMGIPVLKSPMDLWNYQEIIFTLKPSLLVEFGTFRGGSAHFFSTILRQCSSNFAVLTVDVDHSCVHAEAKKDPFIEFLTLSSSDPAVASRISQLRLEHPGSVFAILDSDHSKKHVLAELELLRPLLTTGDYLIVEDSNINGHPVLPLWGEGPFEAVEEYDHRYPDDYIHDNREHKFGWSFAPHGFLVRR